MKSRHEKKVAQALTEKGIENYVPIRKELRSWSDRKKWVETVVITCYVFVKVTPKQREQVLQTDSVVNFVRIARQDACIPDEQMELLQMVLGDTELDVELNYEDLQPGEFFEVLSGPFQGKTVELVQLKGKKKGRVSLQGVSVVFEIDLKNLVKSTK